MAGWLTVTGTAVFQVGRLMCTDSTTITGTAIFQDQAQSHLFPAGLVPWAYLTCLFKSSNVWAVLHEMLRFRANFLNESSIGIRCRRLSNEGQPNQYADLRPGSADIVIVPVFTNLKWLRFTAKRILDSPTSDILPQEADHEYCYDLRCSNADILRGVRMELKFTVPFLFSILTFDGSSTANLSMS